MTVAVQADVFPAIATVSRDGQETTLDRVRVIVTETSLAIFQDHADGPRLIFNQGLSSYAGPARPNRLREATAAYLAPHVADLADGSHVDFRKSGGCGCGSRLKSFNPFSQLSTLTAVSE